MLEHSLRKTDALFILFCLFFAFFRRRKSSAKRERIARQMLRGKAHLWFPFYRGKLEPRPDWLFAVEYPRLLHIGVPLTGATGLGKQVGSEIGKVGKLINKH